MELTLGKIANLLDGVVEGDESITINSLSTLKDGSGSDLSFLANSKYRKDLEISRCGAVLVNSTIGQINSSVNLIKVDDAYTSFAIILELFERNGAVLRKGIEEPVFINQESNIAEDVYVGAFSYIASGANIGKGTQIYPQVYIGENVEIGEKCVVFPGVKIFANTKIGDNCTLHSGAIIGSEGFGFAPQKGGGFKRIPQIGNVVLGDHVSIGANTTIDRGTVSSTRIESGVKLDNLVHIGHNVSIGQDSAIAAQAGIAGSTVIGNHCMFGGQVGIVGHIEVANHTQIAPKGGVMSSIKEEGRKLLGAPVMDFRHTKKVWVAWRKLPEMQKKIEALEATLIKNH
ncbi:MAG: UDP-3-O-(3-hydroxymyristoyl)glucosamine N-acyltransferase [Bacteroidetes bacterium]|nr:UDP-3-O-(3-hydroxymyristoyl)glucosamine N-acyltransferase [Bacteroidota bacterium]MDA1120109.1 UDP-3-O-(3-hydroxymyristoyl)glucosamine N-acyltransferase [Bacteroidota bacterium]